MAMQELWDSLGPAKEQLVFKSGDPFSLALNQYPELRNKKIIVVESDQKRLLTSRPFWLNYRIVVSSQYASELYLASFDAQIGAFAHELQHIVDYCSMNVFQLIAFGMKYVFSCDFRRQTEWHTDMAAMKRGFAKQIYAFSTEIVTNKKRGKKRLREIQTHYLTSKQIKFLLKQG